MDFFASASQPELNLWRLKITSSTQSRAIGLFTARAKDTGSCFANKRLTLEEEEEAKICLSLRAGRS